LSVCRPSLPPSLILVAVTSSSSVNTFGPSLCGEQPHPAILCPTRAP
jgi:hypothetical protein